MRVDDELRAAWRSLAEVEEGLPGHDYDRGYLTGWYDVRRGIRKRIRPRFGYRDPERQAVARLGYLHGREDGVGRLVDWWPDYAIGGEEARLRLLADRAALAADSPAQVSPFASQEPAEGPGVDSGPGPRS